MGLASNKLYLHVHIMSTFNPFLLLIFVSFALVIFKYRGVTLRTLWLLFYENGVIHNELTKYHL